MMEIAVLLAAVAFAVAVGFLVPTLLELRRAAKETSLFLKETRESLKTTLAETEESLKNLREITEAVNSVTRDARAFTSALYDAAENVRGLSGLAEELVSDVSARISGIKAGLGTALEVLIKNFFKKEDAHER